MSDGANYVVICIPALSGLLGIDLRFKPGDLRVYTHSKAHVLALNGSLHPSNSIMMVMVGVVCCKNGEINEVEGRKSFAFLRLVSFT